MKKRSVRLPAHIVPTEYDIKLRPDLENFTFEGVETISIKVLKPTKVITLHSKELDISTASITINKDKIFAKISYNTKSETATFTFLKKLKGKVKLTLTFKGILNDKMRGFYKSSYIYNDKVNNLATTQFEATDARRAFPCFDEPAHKAVFHLSLVVPRGKSAISNTLPITREIHEAGYEILRFAPTPRMSTYLLAFIIGDFEYIEKKSNRGVIVRVHTTPGKLHQAEFALDTTVKVLEFYEKYFDIPYPLNTLDMVAIPDFQSGAMENWGAITYRESALLVDAKNSSLHNKQWVALVIAHELAHQWFGNLVTMEWWTHLWLNEGFASYIEYLAVNKLFPEWDIWTQFCTNDLGVALRLDSLANTHPIEIPVHHPDEIGEIFDEVSYSKGASVIRMLAGYLGERDFRDGLRYYLKKHSYKNTETVHLWQAFEKVSGKPVTRMMHNWTSKPGYPVVKAEIRQNKLIFSQKRFFSSPISAKKIKDRTLWQIPLNPSRIIKTNFLRGLASDGEPISGFFKLQKIRTGKKFRFDNLLFKLNFSETGFFRTVYSRELLDEIKKQVVSGKLPSSDKLGIIRDLFASAEAGIIPTTDALEFLSAYRDEKNYTVWLEISSGLARIEQILPSGNHGMDKLIQELFSQLVARLGFSPKKNEPHTDTLLRSLAIARAGRAGDKNVIARARALFTSGKIPPDIRSAVYGIVATHGTIKEFNKLLAKYKAESLHEEKNRLGGALGDFKDPSILKQVCEFTLSKHVRPQDTVSIISGVGGNPLGRDIWLSFVMKNWKSLVARYGDGGHTLSRLVKAISGSAEERHFKKFKQFFAKNEAPGAKRSIEQVLERLESNIAWRKRDQKLIHTFLSTLLD